MGKDQKNEHEKLRQIVVIYLQTDLNFFQNLTPFSSLNPF